MTDADIKLNELGRIEIEAINKGIAATLNQHYRLAKLEALNAQLLAAAYGALVPLEHAIDGQAMDDELERAAQGIRDAIAAAKEGNDD